MRTSPASLELELKPIKHDVSGTGTHRPVAARPWNGSPEQHDAGGNYDLPTYANGGFNPEIHRATVIG
jgi:hypothetical protein